LQIKSYCDVKELCRDYCFENCKSDHPNICTDFQNFYSVLKEIKKAISCVSNTEKKASFEKEMSSVCENHREYMAHLVRTKHQGDYYKYVTNNLKPGEVIVIIDYKMKLELGQRLRENQREWYGKRGISIHGFYVMAKVVIITLIFMIVFLL